MKTTKSRMTVNKGGNGGATCRTTLPLAWIREMGLGEDSRDLRLDFDGKTITIINNKQEIKMLNNLLEKAKVEIEKEMDRIGFIDDSDNIDRFLDNLIERLIEEALEGIEEIEEEDLRDDLLEMATDFIQGNYESKGSTNSRGDYTGCYYKNEKGLKAWSESGE